MTSNRNSQSLREHALPSENARYLEAYRGLVDDAADYACRVLSMQLDGEASMIAPSDSEQLAPASVDTVPEVVSNDRLAAAPDAPLDLTSVRAAVNGAYESPSNVYTREG